MADFNYEYTLPYPPSVNHMYARTRTGGVRLTNEATLYHGSVKGVIGACEPLSCDLQLVILAYMPDRRVRDLDNILKITLDALTKAGRWVDDKLIKDLRVVNAGVDKPGRLVVSIQNLGVL